MLSFDYHARTPGLPRKDEPRHLVRNQPRTSGWVIVNTGTAFLGPRWQVQCLAGDGRLATQAEAIALARQALVPCNDRGIVPARWHKQCYRQGRLPT